MIGRPELATAYQRQGGGGGLGNPARPPAAARAASPGGPGGPVALVSGPSGTSRPIDSDNDVANRLAKIMSSDSNLMRRASATGVQSANRRGLSNSSLSAGASTNAVIAAAAPIASQDSQQYQQRAINDENNENSRNITNAGNINTRRINDNGNENQRYLADVNNTHSRDINNANLAAAERERQLAAYTSMQNTYSSSLTNTLQNPDIPASARDAVQRSLLDQRTAGLRFMQDLYGTGGGEAVAPATPQAPPAGYAGFDPQNPNYYGGLGGFSGLNFSA